MAKKKKSPPVETTSKRSIKEERLFQNLLKITVQLIQSKRYSPMTQQELFKKLTLPEQHLEIFREVLSQLETQKEVVVRKTRYENASAKTSAPVEPRESKDIARGTIRMHPRGFGFLQADDQVLFPQDIFIPKHLTQNAVDGDTVEVLVNTKTVSEKGPEGKIIAILERGRTHLGAIIRTIEYGEIIAYAPMLGASQRVIVQRSSEFSLKVGDRIVMAVVEWGDKDSPTRGTVSRHVGHISDPSCDIKAAIEEYELRSDFPSDVIEEAQSFGTQVSRKDIAEREDLRYMECFTIDPDTAKDYDDAVSLTKDAQGHYHLGVHIADVSHYVKKGSALDEEARLRCNSTYFPAVCLPMLPSELSNNLCSLKANVNRLTASVLVEFDPEGTMVNYRITRSVIKSAKRFTYKEAKTVLDGTKTSKHLPTLKRMVELCGHLKKKRYERGSIEFAIPELVVIVDENGMPYKTDFISYDITHQLVEEFMLKANEIVALHLSQKGKNLTYRIHDEPAEENMRDFSVLAGSFGYRLSETPTPVELQKMFDEALETAYGQYLATSYIRRMRLAVYSPDNIGHYGLGLTHYCHFTSPIRRYVDLVVHRILFGDSDERTELEQIAVRCSDQERISAKAESNVVLLKKLRLLDTMHKKEPRKQYEAIITRVKGFGIYFEILDLMLEGFLHISDLDGDYYVFEESMIRLRGVHRGGIFSSGNKITVMLKSLDFILLESEWHLVPEKRSDAAERPSKDFRESKSGKGKKSFKGKTKEKHKDKERHTDKKNKGKRVVKEEKAKPAKSTKGFVKTSVSPIDFITSKKSASKTGSKVASKPIPKIAKPVPKPRTSLPKPKSKRGSGK